MRHRTRVLTLLAVIVFVPIGAGAPEPSDESIVISEVAWAGAEWDATAEWIELFNASSDPIDLDGWHLITSDGSPDIDLCGTILPHVDGDPTTGYLLLERGNDDSVPGIAADLIYHGALTDRGEALYLCDPSGNLVDTANAPTDEPSPWPAGSAARGIPSYASMERRDYRLPDAPENWASSSAEFAESADRVIRGTPKMESSAFNILPIPAFDFEPRHPAPGLSIEFDASNSFDKNNNITSYRWDFGDGNEGFGPIVDHAYAHPGEYHVALTLTDAKGGESELMQSISVRVTARPIADFSVIVLPPNRVARAGSPTWFQDESSDLDGEIAVQEWQFGDGTTDAGAAVIHTYDRAGVFLVHLQVYDEQENMALQTRSLTVASRLPIASFTRVPEAPNANDPVRFDASDSCDPDGHIVVYRWDFDGDGAYEQEISDPIAEHAFPTAGDHDVHLFVVDDTGDTSDAFLETIRVNVPPIAQFQLSFFESTESEPIGFTDMSYDEDGSIMAWLWDFGDGTTAATPSAEHTFQDDGAFAVSLTVTDDSGAQRKTAAEVVIANLPPIVELVSAASILPTGESFRLDASASADPSPRGTITQYEWDVDGDGAYDATTTAPTLSHAYGDDGEYEVRVRATDDDGATALSDPLPVTVTNRPPRVDRIDWTPEAPTDDTEVRFLAGATDPDGEIAQWFWDLGNETVVTGPSPAIVFPDDGRYTITLTVQDNDGARSDPLFIELVVENAPPIAAFVVVASGGRCVAFDALDSYDPSPTGEILHFAWDFGDQTTCPGTPGGCGQRDRRAPDHCYSEPGTYVVTLVVIDEQGALARSTKTIHIAE